jgi:hypothetical protein
MCLLLVHVQAGALTGDTFEAALAGKKAFIKFQAPW